MSPGLSKAAASAFIENALVVSKQRGMQHCIIVPDPGTTDADKERSDFLMQIEPDEIRKHIDESMKSAVKEYQAYLRAGYLKTAACYLKHIFDSCLLKNDINSASGLFNSEVLGTTDEHYRRHIFNRIAQSIRDKQKPRLLFYSNVWVKGGIERVVSILCKRLISDYEIVVVSSNYEEDRQGYELPEKVLHIQMSKNLNKRLNFSLVEICLLLNVDICIGNPNFLYDFLGIYKILKDLKIKTICCNHVSYFLPHSQKYLFPVVEIRNDAYSAATVVTWPTTFAFDVYSNVLNNGAWLPNPNTFQKLGSKPKIYKEEIILCVGRFFDAVKRLDKALIVFKKVLEKNPNAQLCVVGGHDLETIFPSNGKSLKQVLSELNIDPKSILWEGEQSDLQSYYENCSVLMLTSDSEGFSMVLSEAAVYGLPAVLFDIPGLDDVVMDKVTAFIVKDDSDEMAERICLLLSDQDLRFQMGEAAQEFIQRFDGRLISEKWKVLINILLNENDRDIINSQVQNQINMRQGARDVNYKRIIMEYEKALATIIKTYETERKHYTETRTGRLIHYFRSYGFFKTALRIGVKLSTSVMARNR